MAAGSSRFHPGLYEAAESLSDRVLRIRTGARPVVNETGLARCVVKREAPRDTDYL